VTTLPSLLEDSLSNSPFSEASLFPTVCAITFHASQRFARSPHSLQWPFQSIEELGYSRLVEYAYSCASKCDPIPLSRLSIVLMRFLVVCFVFFSILLNNVSQFQLSYWHVHGSSSSCIPHLELHISLLNLFWSTTTVP